jgi:hypothetical protein
MEGAPLGNVQANPFGFLKPQSRSLQQTLRKSSREEAKDAQPRPTLPRSHTSRHSPSFNRLGGQRHSLDSQPYRLQSSERTFPTSDYGRFTQLLSVLQAGLDVARLEAAAAALTPSSIEPLTA